MSCADLISHPIFDAGKRESVDTLVPPGQRVRIDNSTSPPNGTDR
ncbi:hypothetical protein LGN09_29910 [Burkholderia cenocepacia]|nr:hypothetical protein [Burkholderia cenocepacia]